MHQRNSQDIWRFTRMVLNKIYWDYSRFKWRPQEILQSRQTTAQAMTNQTSAQNPNQMSHFYAIGPSLQAASPVDIRH
jgi:hypothetical protein